jgi:dCMP deaminase
VENIYDTFIPGNKKSPGKLLDMCRSLHAEEMCLLRVNTEVNKDMVLYVTTQPCPLCANKIVIKEVKEVVFTETYDLEESSKILKGCKLRRFEGVKSSAFFKLYS